MSILLRIAELTLNRPLLVHPDKVPLILAVLSGRIPIDGEAADELKIAADARIAELPEAARAALQGPTREASRFVGEAVDTDPATGKTKSLPYRRTSEGVAIISILGALANRGVSLERGSFSKQSYEGIKFQLQAAANDPRTTAVLLDIESPGGEATGAFEVADAVRDLAAVKPVVAVVNGMAASAAYAIASAASKIVTLSTGVVGSIGVVMVHGDFSRQLDKAGVTPTLIFAGAHKVDGNPFEPLSAAVTADLQAEVNQFYDMFVDTVAKGRRGMSPKSIRETEARTFIGADAVKIGLADEVGTFESALADLTRGAGRLSLSIQRGNRMANEKGTPEANAGTVAQADHDKAVSAARTEGHAAGKAEAEKATAEAVKKAAADERSRISAIVSLEEAKGREAQALAIATTTDLSADQAKAILAASPKGSPLANRDASLSPLGIVTEGDKPGATGAALSPEALAADLNKQNGAARR